MEAKMASKHEHVHGEDRDHDHGSEGSAGSDGIDQFFFGSTVTSKTPLTLSTLMTELHVTQACLSAGKGPVVVKAATSKIEKATAICVLSSAAPHALLDLSFFHGDEAVTFTLEGAGADAAEVSLSGSVAVIGELPEDEEDEGEEEDEEEEEEEEDDEEEDDEEDPEEAAPAAEAAKPLSAVDKLKRKREEAERAASSSADAAISKAAAARPAKQARKEGKADAGAGAAAAGGAGAAPKAEKAAEKPKAAAAGGMQELANGNLKFSDTVVGSGPRASRGDKVTVSYVGKLANGKVFDRSESFPFKLGVGSVIKGWDLGVAGMAVGGKRTLIIHPSLGYGKSGSPPVIPPNATLIFEVQLKKIR